MKEYTLEMQIETSQLGEDHLSGAKDILDSTFHLMFRGTKREHWKLRSVRVEYGIARGVSCAGMRIESSAYTGDATVCGIYY
jgi:hypothetical protein